MNCWEKEDRCEDCPADHAENRCSQYKKDLTAVETESKQGSLGGWRG